MADTSPRSSSPLDALADAYVEEMARRDPFAATTLGISGHAAEVTD